MGGAAEMKRRVLSATGIAALAATWSLGASADDTRLTQLAASLEPGMQRSSVISRLGKPTWAVRRSDQGPVARSMREYSANVNLVYYWENGSRHCPVVRASFDDGGVLLHIDEGFGPCRDFYDFGPGDEYLCANAGRSDICN